MDRIKGRRLFDGDQLILFISKADLHAVRDGGAPVGVRVDSMEMVVVIMVAVRRLAKLRMGQDGLTVDRVGTGDVERDGIERGEHADIRHDGGVVLGVAVAVRGDVADDRDMEARAARDDGLAVFSDLGIQDFRLRVVARLDTKLLCPSALF